MDFEEKLITVQQAVDMVKSGDYIVTGLGASTADAFLQSSAHGGGQAQERRHLHLPAVAGLSLF